MKMIYVESQGRRPTDPRARDSSHGNTGWWALGRSSVGSSESDTWQSRITVSRHHPLKTHKNPPIIYHPLFKQGLQMPVAWRWAYGFLHHLSQWNPSATGPRRWTSGQVQHAMCNDCETIDIDWCHPGYRDVGFLIGLNCWIPCFVVTSACTKYIDYNQVLFHLQSHRRPPGSWVLLEGNSEQTTKKLL